MAAAVDLAFSTWSTTTSPLAVAVSQILDRRRGFSQDRGPVH